MKKLVVFCCLVMAVSLGYSQKTRIVSGDFKEIKGEKTVELSFKYDKVSIGNKSEAQYLEEKVSERNAKKPGSGDKFKESWYNDRPTRMEPKFEELVNKYTEKKNLVLSRNAKESKYMFIVRTKNIDPGFNVGVMSRPAYIDFEITLVDKSNPTKELGMIEVNNSTGQDAMGWDFDAGTRYSESFAKCGKMVGKLLIDKVLK